LSIRPDILEEATRLLLNTDKIRHLPPWAAHSSIPAEFARFHKTLMQFMNMGIAEPTLLGTPEGRGLEQDCIRSLIASLDFSPARHPHITLPGRARLIRRAEDFMRSRLANPMGAIDLCRELGVSDRTLRKAFRDTYGIGPMVYYRYLRLNVVRSHLLANPTVTVAEMAQRFGFHHLGNFAADYRRLFGERPSETRA
jgi:AraC family transcriptional regulator, ethanolamine operon transcriptional activator